MDFGGKLEQQQFMACQWSVWPGGWVSGDLPSDDEALVCAHFGLQGLARSNKETQDTPAAEDEVGRINCWIQTLLDKQLGDCGGAQLRPSFWINS